MGTTSQTSASVSPARPRDTTTGSEQGPTPSQVSRNVQTIADLEAKSSAQRSALDRFSDRVSSFASSTSFLLIHVAWFAGWVVLNSVLPNAVDSYPFTFLTLLTSLEAIFLTSFVLISQNHLESSARRRAELDLQINLLAEREMTSVLRTVSAIAAHLGLPEADTDLQELAEQTDVEAVARTVEHQMEVDPESRFAGKESPPARSAGKENSH